MCALELLGVCVNVCKDVMRVCAFVSCLLFLGACIAAFIFIAKAYFGVCASTLWVVRINYVACACLKLGVCISLWV